MKTLIFVLSAVVIVSSQYHGYSHLYPQHIPVIDHRGVPVDTPEVQAARASHLAALSAANHGHPVSQHTTPWAYTGHYGNAYAHYGLPVIAPDGTPVDTPEVQHAKSAHFAAFNEAAARNGVAEHHRYRRDLYYAYPYSHYFPVIGHDGHPVETPEVQAAKAEHFAAHAEARYRTALGPLDYTHGRYAAHVPIVTDNGVPVDTPEVQHAKAAHFAAHAEATARNHYGAHYTVVPVDTPEVQLAKIQHFAAHQAAISHH